MAKRVISSIVGLPVLIALVLLGGAYLKGALLVMGLLGLYEFYRAVYGKIQLTHIVGMVFSFVYVVWIEYIYYQYLSLFIALFVLVLLFMMVFFHQEVSVEDSAVTLYGFFYVVFLLSHVLLVRMTDAGNFLVWLIFICAWGSDTGAYLTGISIGRHKLTPQLSPNKTVEGSIGGIVLAGLISLLYFMAVRQFQQGLHSAVVYVFIGVVGAAFSQMGDLAASSIKRKTKIKDFGSIIPGHGGVMDRFDSVLITAPVVYYLLFFYRFAVI